MPQTALGCQSFFDLTQPGLGVLGSRLRMQFSMLLSQVSSGQIGVKKTERVRHLYNTHPGFALLLDDLIA